jgi:hypothetical protein
MALIDRQYLVRPYACHSPRRTAAWLAPGATWSIASGSSG